MAKKNEFRPDKSGNSLLNRLQLTQQQRKKLLKWVCYALVLTLLSVLQDVILTRFRVNGATPDMVPCGIFLICLAEGTESGSIFALIASLLYLFSGTAPGPYAMVFITFLAVVSTAFRQGYLQKGFGAAMLCTAVSMVTYEMALFGLGLFLQLTTAQRVTGFLLTAAMTMILAPFIYVLVRSVSRIGGQEWTE